VASAERRIAPGIRDDPPDRAVHVKALVQRHAQDKWRKQMERIRDIHAGTSRCAPTIEGGSGMNKIAFEPDETMAEQLAELVKRTERPQEDLINAILAQTLRQLIEDNDTDLLRAYLR
jgi:hypothetical protein